MLRWIATRAATTARSQRSTTTSRRACSALEVAGRIACRSALIISTGVDAELAASLKRIARREGVHLLGGSEIKRLKLSQRML